MNGYFNKFNNQRSSRIMVIFEVILLNVLNTFLLTTATSDDGYTLTVDDMRRRLGTILNPNGCDDSARVVHEPDFIASLPESFDARDHWPDCPSISHIRNQGNCGNCWAFGVTEVITDRYCIKSNGTKQFTFSAQDLTSCDTSNTGCEGGYLDNAFKFWIDTGIVSGGDYESNEGCYPYEIPPESAFDWETPPCKNTCRAGYNIEYLQDKHRGKNFACFKSEGDMMAEIYKNGPIATGFDVYTDFFEYKTGVYEYKWGHFEGGHAVKTIGWGVENDKKYWLVANSWGTSWGLEGFFKYIRGINQGSYEDNSVAGEPIVEN